MLDFRPHKLYIKATEGEPTFDENGDPVPSGAWGDAIPCHFSTEGRENIYIDSNDGSHTVYTYEVWIDPISKDLKGKQVRLEDQFGNEIPGKTVQKCVNRQLRTKLYL